MDLSDCPFAVGTPEHSKWITNVYIPTVNDRRMAEDGAKVGAESQGRKVIHGHTHNIDGTKKESVRESIPIMRAPRGPISFTRLDEGDLDLGIMPGPESEQHFKVFFEEYTGITGLIEQRARLLSFDTEVSSEMRRVLFGMVDDLPEVSGAGYSRGGPSRAKRRAKPVKAKQQRNQMVPKKVRECPRHGGPADRCRICQR